MTTLLNYLTAFWTVVVMNCVQPVNWEYCKDPHIWLLPELEYGVKIYMNPETIYQQEREALEQ